MVILNYTRTLVLPKSKAKLIVVIIRYEVEVSTPDSFDISCPVRIIHGLKVQ